MDKREVEQSGAGLVNYQCAYRDCRRVNRLERTTMFICWRCGRENSISATGSTPKPVEQAVAGVEHVVSIASAYNSELHEYSLEVGAILHFKGVGGILEFSPVGPYFAACGCIQCRAAQAADKANGLIPTYTKPSGETLPVHLL